MGDKTHQPHRERTRWIAGLVGEGHWARVLCGSLEPLAQRKAIRNGGLDLVANVVARLYRANHTACDRMSQFPQVSQ